MPSVPFDAVVLTGGRGTRLGGVDKAAVVVAGTTLLDRARDVVGQASVTVVVGPVVAGGPVAGIAAGLRQVGADVVVLLACDMPLLRPQTVTRLVDVLAASDAAGHDTGSGSEKDPGTVDGVLLRDHDGRRQYLAGAYRTARLRSAVHALGTTDGASVRRLVEGLHLRELDAHPEETMDCDTWPDVARAVRLLEER